MSDHPIFTVGGTVQAGGGIYLPRPADDELLAHCLAGDFCYVLTARQMGKSSLMVRTAERLREQERRAVIIDLTRLGTSLQAEQWYLGLIDEIVEQLDLDIDYRAWWEKYAHLGVTLRLSRFLREKLIAALSEPLVIFIDEIDTTLSLPFSDDFFAAIRACYNARSTDPAYRRLSFVLLGVATPGDLIRDPQRTPFNIGTRIDLTDFTIEQALPLAEGFNLPNQLSKIETLKSVLSWTNGHPYLTQRLCRALLERNQTEWSETSIAQAVEETFFGEKSKQDTNLQFVRDMLTLRAPDVRKVLQAYAKVRAGKKVKNEEQSLVVSHLKISGIVREQDGFLVVRNRIYEHIFDPVWIKKSLPSSVPVRLAWASSIVAVIALLVAGYFGYQELTLSDAARAARFETRFAEATTPAGQLDNLAGLIQLSGGAYTPRAISLFQRMSQAEKLALFENVRAESDQLLLARQVYQRIYNGPPVPEGQQEQDDLLRAIGKSVRNADPALEREIEDWLEGRLELANDNYTSAINKFNYALGSARANPAILLDLAHAHAGQARKSAYEQALQALARAAEVDTQKITTIQARRMLNNSTDFGLYWLEQRERYPELTELVEVPMAQIPAGSFQMGSDPERALAECQKYYDSCNISDFQDEAPIHAVTLDAFMMDLFEVTNAEYALCIADGVCSTPKDTDISSFIASARVNGNFPVISISWFDAKTYCNWRGARLPTEAEWEYAARGGLEGKHYPWGNILQKENANLATAEFCCGSQTLLFPSYTTSSPDQFSEVYSYLPNKYGVYNMSGNVSEWVMDWYDSEYYKTVQSVQRSPSGPTVGESRVVRGGSWQYLGYELRVSHRFGVNPYISTDFIGFRCARSSEIDKQIVYVARFSYGISEIMIANSKGESFALTNDGKSKDSPAPSPDGKYVAYVAHINDNSDIYMVNVSDRSIIRLTSSVSKDGWPSWSPDGRLVTFESFRDGNFEIYAIDIQTLTEIRLTDNPAGDGRPTWSPDGRWILFVSNRDGGVDIYRMDADGSNVIRLTTETAPDASPSWSSDGQWIAFTSWRDGNPEIYKMRADGSAQQRLTTNNARDDYPFWSPDGQKILFLRGDSGKENIVLMDASGANAYTLQDNGPRTMPPNNAYGIYPAWSPDGLYIAYQGETAIYITDFNGTILQTVSNPDQQASQPVWFP